MKREFPASPPPSSVPARSGSSHTRYVQQVLERTGSDRPEVESALPITLFEVVELMQTKEGRKILNQHMESLNKPANAEVNGRTSQTKLKGVNGHRLVTRPPSVPSTLLSHRAATPVPDGSRTSVGNIMLEHQGIRKGPSLALQTSPDKPSESRHHKQRQPSAKKPAAIPHPKYVVEQAGYAKSEMFVNGYEVNMGTRAPSSMDNTHLASVNEIDMAMVAMASDQMDNTCKKQKLNSGNNLHEEIAPSKKQKLIKDRAEMRGVKKHAPAPPTGPFVPTKPTSGTPSRLSPKYRLSPCVNRTPSPVPVYQTGTGYSLQPMESPRQEQSPCELHVTDLSRPMDPYSPPIMQQAKQNSLISIENLKGFPRGPIPDYAEHKYCLPKLPKGEKPPKPPITSIPSKPKTLKPTQINYRSKHAVPNYLPKIRTKTVLPDDQQSTKRFRKTYFPCMKIRPMITRPTRLPQPQASSDDEED